MAAETARKDAGVGWWLIAVCVLVFAMIMVGGATRLTDSGLSITEWKPISGAMPPLSARDWDRLFDLYKQTTEYREQNSGMSMSDFQTLYWWEWGHRLLGRVIGLVFALPFFFFLFTGRLKGRLVPTTVLFALGGLQGFIGWWMVTSGLFSGTDVSPVRLAIHLSMAFVILALALWLALGAFGWPKHAGSIAAPRWAPFALMGLIFCQLMFGALLAGSDGGPAFADWPTIGGQIVPAHAFDLEPFTRNFVQNHATQHLFHRTLGYVVALTALTLAFLAWTKGAGAGRKMGVAVGAMALCQALLGIATVMSASPLSLSLIHQAGAAVLWMTALAASKSVPAT